MERKIIITIGREFGSGGSEIAFKLAEKLNIKMYDKNLIHIIAKNSGLCEDIISDVDETASNSFLYALSSGALSGANFMSHGMPALPITDKAFIATSQVIKDIANKESCVIVGRCAESVLKDYDNVFSVFVYGDMENKIARITAKNEVKRDEAISLIKRTDKKRAGYHNYYFDTRWGSRNAYDLCINSKIGIDAVVDIILTAVKNMH